MEWKKTTEKRSWFTQLKIGILKKEIKFPFHFVLHCVYVCVSVLNLMQLGWSNFIEIINGMEKRNL